MNKDLDYEFNNFANLLHKDCMNLMECLKKQSEDNKPILYLGKHYEKVILPYEEYQKMCNRLEAIDNSNPSEALEELIDMIEYFTRLDYVEPIVRNEIHDKFKDIYWHKLPHLDSIKEALLKAQETKHYLKWEDLKFDRKEKIIKVKLGDNVYYLIVGLTTGGNNLVTFHTELKRHYFTDTDKQFFNDLHLERVEE